MIHAKEVYRLLTLGDKLLISTLLVLGISSFSLAGLATQPGEYALISVAGQPTIRKPLHRQDLFILQGATGTLVVEINESSIRVLDATCPQRLCVRQGRIDHVGEIIVCVPNKVTIWIEGRNPNPFDAITG